MPALEAPNKMIPLPIAAQQLRIRQDTARDWISLGLLEGRKVGGTRWYVTADSLRKQLRSRLSEGGLRDAFGRFTSKRKALGETA